MKHTASDFLKLRSLIIQNSILGQLLSAYLGNNSPIVVGKSLRKLDGSLRKAVKKDRGNKEPPRYVMVDINIRTVDPYRVDVGHTYSYYPTIWTRTVTIYDRKNISQIKSLVRSITRYYNINASKADRVLGKIPQSLVTLLESSGISSNFWRLGFSKPLKKNLSHPINEKELDDYYSKLFRALNDWRIFNRILIELLKNGRFEIHNPKFGSLSIVPYTPDSTFFYFSFDSIDGTKQYTIVPHFAINPEGWETINQNLNTSARGIDIFTLRNVFTSKR